ncbi:MAG: hypothetical protein K5986_07185 [Clostridium sp.]|nr:hypothetical protein [Clostridium sp.]
MNKNICFIELIKDQDGFFKAGQTIGTACIRAYLKENKVNSMMYLDDSLPSINDMSDDILSLSDEILVFKVHEECEEILQVLISNIRELEEDVEIYTLGNTNLRDDVISIKANYGAELLKLLEDKNDSKCLDELSVSPYANGIVLPRDISKYGIWIGVNNEEKRNISAIKEDLEKLSEVYAGLSESEEKVIKLEGGFIEDSEFLKNIIDEIEKIDIPFLKFLIPVDENNFCDVVEISKKSDKYKFLFNFHEALKDLESEQLVDLIKNKRIEEIYLNVKLIEEDSKFVSIVLMAASKKLISVLPFGEIESNKINDETKQILLENTRREYLPFFRGFLNSRLGLYGAEKADGYVRHLEVSDEFINKGDLEFINEIMNVNSSVYVKDKNINIKDDKWYFDEVGTCNVSDKNFDDTLKIFNESNANLSNLINVYDRNVHNNSLSYVSHNKVCEISYKEVKDNLEKIKMNTKDEERYIYIFKLTDKEDFELFLEDAKKYKDNHTIVDMPLAYGYLENSCRFLYTLGCNVEKIPRLKIDDEGNMYTCDMQLKPVSKVGGSLFEISHNVISEKEKILHEKGCYTCPTKMWCNKCTQLPECIEEKYCNIMKEDTYVLDYVMLPFIFFRLRETNPKFKDITPENIKVSNEYMFNYISSDLRGEVAPYLPKFTTFLTIGDKYLLWSPMTAKFYNVSKEFACVVELLLRRIKKEKMPELLSELLSIDMENSMKIIEFAINSLKKAGVLYREFE